MNRIEQLIAHGDELFQKRGQLLTLWQDLADNFYVERADFTLSRTLGTDFAAHLMTGYPLIVRRELSNAFSSMLRPRDRSWFTITVDREEVLDLAGRRWLEQATEIQRRAMYDTDAGFVRATKQGDADFATFGQCVLSRITNWRDGALLYQNWHLRDVAWCEDEKGFVDEIHRRWRPTLRQLSRKFKLHPEHEKRLQKEPYAEVDVRHVVYPSANYDSPVSGRFEFASVFIDVENKYLLEETGSRDKIYTIPRWQTVSGSQYAFSPATVIALPDARLIQAMTLTLLEAGEMAVRPPLLATQEAIRSDIALKAGGITWVDAAYDERTGDALRPITQDKRALPFGLEMNADVRVMLNQAFFLNKLELPAPGGEMTATEVAQRVQEYIRSALPLFEPMEVEYNAALCESTFDDLMHKRAFGPWEEIPRSIRNNRVKFQFESPLHRALQREKTAHFAEARELILQAVELDPTANAVMDVRKALVAALEGVGAPADWMRDEDEQQAMVDEADQMQRAAAMAQIAETGGKAAASVGKAVESVEAAA
jgi:hypothetical protein